MVVGEEVEGCWERRAAMRFMTKSVTWVRSSMPGFVFVSFP